jgi:streptogramin lyase
LSRSKLVLIISLTLLLLTVAFFTFEYSPRSTSGKDHVQSASTFVVSPTKRNVVPETLSSNPKTTVSNPLTTVGTAYSPTANSGFSLIRPAFAISPSQVTVTFTEWPLPSTRVPEGVAVDSSGNVYFAENAGKIGRLVPSTNAVTEWPVPTSSSQLWGVAVDSSGNVYFTEASTSGNKIGSLS